MCLLNYNLTYAKKKWGKLKEHWYQHVQKSVESQEGKVTILCNQQVQTDRTTPNNKPDITVRNSEKGTFMSIDVEISGDRNMIKKNPRIF